MKITKWRGKPVGMPGIYSGMPLEWYHSADACIEPAISSTGLRRIFSKSPAHYWVSSPYNPKHVEDEDTAAKLLGRAAHHLLLGETKFKEKFAIRPEMLGGDKWHGGRNVCKMWIAERKDEGRQVISSSQVEAITGMVEGLTAEPLIKAGLLNGLVEHSLFAKDKETGFWLKVRPDVLPNDSLDFVDLKLTTSVVWKDLQRTIRDYGYYQQAALVAEVVPAVLGQRINSFTLVFIENKPPHCVEIVTLKEIDIERGHRANRQALRKLAECWKKKQWPGPRGVRDDARYIEMAEWDQKSIDATLSAGI